MSVFPNFRFPGQGPNWFFGFPVSAKGQTGLFGFGAVAKLVFTGFSVSAQGPNFFNSLGWFGLAVFCAQLVAKLVSPVFEVSGQTGFSVSRYF